MNLKIHTVPNDIAAKTGMAILEAIINGERKAANFYLYLKASSETICKWLQGHWRAEHLFLLKQSYTMYQFIQEQIVLSDEEIEGVLRLMMAYKKEGVTEKVPGIGSSTEEVSIKKRNKSHPGFNKGTEKSFDNELKKRA